MTTSTRSSRARLALPLAALLVLSACSQGGAGTAPTPQETSMPSATSGPSEPGTPTPSTAPPTPSATPPAPTSTTPGTEGTGATALLEVSIQQDPGTEAAQYVLECIDGAPGPATTLPGADAACAALGRLGVEFFTALPDKDLICTQQYGGPQTAGITGELDGVQVVAGFSLTDGCQISRWQAAQDILGAPGA